MDHQYAVKSEVLDLVIERDLNTVTKITKNGVVIWPVEPHTAGMLTETQLKELQEAKRRAVHQQEQMLAKSSTPEYQALSRLSRASDYMVGGSHYQLKDSVGVCPHCRGVVQHWDWAHNLRALEYAATKYLARWRDKGGLESLKKVIHYVQKLIEIHFPDVIVSVTYSNTATLGMGGQSGVRGSEASGSPGMAEGSSTYQTALDDYKAEVERYKEACRKSADSVRGDIF